MEFQETVVKDSPGLCRCCLSEGCYKELGAEYTWFNETEIYADMLLDCFDISISQHVEGPNGPNRLICEVCITRLRDACEFKKQVLESEKKFINMVCKGEFSKTVLVYKDPVKVEVKDTDNLDAEYLDEDLDLDSDDLPEKIEIETPRPDNSDLTASMSAVKKKRGRPKKTVIEEEKPIPKKAKLEDKPRTSKEKKSARRSIIKQKHDKLITDRLRRNLAKMLKYSTIMPFKWFYGRYMCFFCPEMFDRPDDLTSHQKAHSEDDFEDALDSFSETEVYVDVRNASCKTCSAVFNDVKSLSHHLNEKHRVRCEENNIKVFKLDDTFTCFICDVKLKSFGSLILHSTRHDPKCHSCIMEDRIDCKHKKEVKCKYCDELFTPDNLKNHIKEEHNKERWMSESYCKKCSITFETPYKKRVHQVEAHKVNSKAKCPHCPLSFNAPCHLRRHIRRRHDKERNCVCEVCAWTCFDQFDLKIHYAHHHSKERNVKCPNCYKSFVTKGDLRQHSKRCPKKNA